MTGKTHPLAPSLAPLVAILLVSPPALGSPSDPIDVVKFKYQEITSVVDRNPERAAMDKGIREVLDTFVDYRELSRRTLADHWEGLKRKQQGDFVDVFKLMIQRSYVRKFNPNKQVRIEYRGGTTFAPDGTATVSTVVHSGKSEARVDYLFHRLGGAKKDDALKDAGKDTSKDTSWWSFDVVIDDVSMVKNYRKQFHDIWDKEGFDGLMKRIRKKNAASAE